MRQRSSAVGPPANGDDATTIAEGFRGCVERIPEQLAVRTKDGEISWTYAELARRADEIAGGLRSLGVKRGDVVGLMLTNCPEFYAADLAITTLGAVSVSLYNTSTPAQISHVVRDAHVGTLICENAFLAKIQTAHAGLPHLEHVVLLGDRSAPDTISWDDLSAAGMGFESEADWRAVEPDDVLTLIYTSGTTGPPKGVQLTHRNMLVTLRQIQGSLQLPEGATGISWLPAAHVAERQAHLYLPMIYGGSITTCPDPRRIAEYLQAVRPHGFFAVPRIWEKLRAGLHSWLASDAVKLAQLDAAMEQVRLDQAGAPVPDDIAELAQQGELELFGELRAMLGLDRTVALQTGAAATPREVLIFFAAIGLPILETWGMSEVCGAGCSMPKDRIKYGSVGPVVDGGEIKLADDGELLFRGEQVMLGYRNQPAKTADTIDAAGWLHTGDIATIDDDGYVRIVDRKKELIINAAGKNMSPANIESAVKGACSLVGQCVAISDARPYNTALITLDPDALGIWASTHDLADVPSGALAEHPAVRGAIQEGVDRANADLSRVEQIKRFHLIGEEWAAGGDELTPTLKLKRKPIAEKYASVIDDLYAASLAGQQS